MVEHLHVVMLPQAVSKHKILFGKIEIINDHSHNSNVLSLDDLNHGYISGALLVYQTPKKKHETGRHNKNWISLFCKKLSFRLVFILNKN